MKDIAKKENTVVLDSKTTIAKLEPFIAAGARGVSFIVQDKDLEQRVIDALREFSNKYRMKIVVRDSSVMDMVGKIATNAVFGANIGFAVWVFMPFAPGLATCVLGGAAIGALTASLKIIITRDVDGHLVLAT